ncbi:2-keto-4-pentenoate hydratase [Devosia crocina]|uniref:2-keto-4-pentenoate hydratase n=1 Tax=Devosia crocina TaxID=429728 RepID=A0A1I7NVF1_9HYPH|nr:hypothetical protein [Devosia crocina]SFV38655.1 2-keto-4-pentenoate hydratase [Devosia crocina]
MSLPPELAAMLVKAHGDDAMLVPAERFAGLTQAEALDIQKRVAADIGSRSPAAKVGLAADGSGFSAPIFAPLVVENAGTLHLPARGIVGIEVEAAVRLGRDLSVDMLDQSDAAWRHAIDDVVVTIELIGSRFDDRRAAGPWGNLADNLSTAGLVIGSSLGQFEVDGLPISVKIDDQLVREDRARLPFGSILAPIRAALASGSGDLFRAGTVVTTGSLCQPLIVLQHDGSIRARLGNALVSAELLGEREPNDQMSAFRKPPVLT